MRFSIIIVLLFIGAGLSAEEKAPRAPVPDAAQTKEAEKTIKDIFKDDYAKRSLEEKKLFGQKLLQQAIESKGDQASHYVLLKESAAIAASGGDADTALSALNALAESFDVDAIALKTETLAKIVPATADAAKTLARAYIKVIDEAVAADNYDTAVKLVTAADTVARKAQDMPLVTQLAVRAKEVRALQGDFAKVKTAQAILKDKPDDPEANAAVGKFLCFKKNDWQSGLALLAKGADAELKDAATKDAAEPADAAEQEAVGELWWKLSEKPALHAQKAALRERAALWYRCALPALTGLAKAKVEKRIETLLKERFGADTPAKLKVQNREPAALSISDAKDGIREVPKFLEGTVAYSKKTGEDNGVVEFEVLASGIVYVACDFAYQGNPSGNWQQERWTQDEFKAKGWEVVPGDLKLNDNKILVIFKKALKAGDKHRLRCNKYLAPLLIVNDPYLLPVKK